MINQKVNIKNQNQAKSSKREVRYRAFYLAIAIIKFLEGLEYKQSIKIISDQMIRCTTSVGANIVEAKSSSSKREFVKFCEIALKSADESKEISNMLGASVLTLKGKRSFNT